MGKESSRIWIGSWLIVTLLLVGCKDSSVIYRDASVQIPALPQRARQPDPPPECLPSCLQNLTSWRARSLKVLTEIE